MADLKMLKKFNPLPDIICETGYPLDYDQKKRIWIGRNDPSLEVDPEKDRYKWGSEKGDIYCWLIKRFGWSFGQVVNFLENRSALPDQARIKLDPSLAGVEKKTICPDGSGDWGEDAIPELKESILKDRRVREALRLGDDYPGGGILRFVGLSSFVLLRECAWLPYQFIGVVGFLADFSCNLCEKDLSDWQDSGQAFQAVEVRGDDSILIPEVYCSHCLKRILRWRRAFNLLTRWEAEQERIWREAN